VSPLLQGMTACRYHPDRPGVGICVRCRAVICAACSTQLDGINYCFACLKDMATQPARPISPWSPWWAPALVLAGSWTVYFVLLRLARSSW
jgi:hypothetical protein